MPWLAQPLSVPVNTNQLQAVEDVCAVSLQCGPADPLGQLLLLVVTGLLAVVVIAVAVHVREARATVAEEQSRTAAEQQAFSQFAREVAGLDAAGTAQLGPVAGGATTVSASLAPRHRGLDAVRTAYEETVLAMDHYEEEYGEPLAEHMRQELGVELATAVEQSRELTPPLQRALVGRAREAARDRERLIRRLDRELDALEAADEELSSVADAVDAASARSLDGRPYTELTDEWHRLGELKSRVSRLVSSRQEELQEASVDGPRTEYPSLNAYLYESLDATVPILADAAALADRLKEARRRVLLALTRRA